MLQILRASGRFSDKTRPMAATRNIRNIALCGFMGTGKSSVGRLVADQLRFAYLDTDTVIEARAGKSITQIFTDQGEAAFAEIAAGEASPIGIAAATNVRNTTSSTTSAPIIHGRASRATCASGWGYHPWLPGSASASSSRTPRA